jgi:MFS family permease
MAAVALVAMAFARKAPALMITVAFAGAAWAMAASEFWVAGQRVVPAWVRGRLNALLIMVGQGGIALGSILLGAGAAHLGLDLTLTAAAILALVGFGIGCRFSINFDDTESVDAAPINPLHGLSPSCSNWIARPRGIGRVYLAAPRLPRTDR